MAGVPEIRYSNNPADYTALDGVIVDERTPPAQIRGVPGNRVCLIGEFERGPVDVPTPFSDTSTFAKTFGGPGPDAAGAFYKGFLNAIGPVWPRGTYILRVSNSTQATSTVNLPDGSAVDVVQVDADSPGVWGDSLSVDVVDATDGVATHFDLVVKRNGTVVERHRNLDLASVGNGELLVTSSDYVVVSRIAAGDGRPANDADVDLTGGSDGTFADADYTGGPADARGIQVLYGASWSDIRWVCTADRNTATVNAALYSLVTSGAIKNAIVAGLAADTPTDAVTGVASYRSDRVGYAYPHGKVSLAQANGGAGGLVNVSLAPFVAAIMATIPPGANPAGSVGERYLRRLRDLTNNTVSLVDLEDFRTQGIMGVAKGLQSQSFRIRSGVTSSLVSGRKNMARRTIADYLQVSISEFLVSFANKAINTENKLQAKSAIEDFLDRTIALGLLPSAEDLNENRPEGSPALAPYEVDIASANSPASEATGTFIIILRVRTFATMDFIVLRTEIGENVEVRLDEAA